jgi:hypothetical protein
VARTASRSREEVATDDEGVDDVIAPVAARLRCIRGPLPAVEFDAVADDIVLDVARFVLEWAETDRLRAPSTGPRVLRAPANDHGEATVEPNLIQGDVAMRFMVLLKSSEYSAAPPEELMSAIAKLAEEQTKAGLLIETAGLLPSPTGAIVRLADGKLTVRDGQLTDADAGEVVGGYAIYEAKSKDEAIRSTQRFMELHKKYWPGWEGQAEVRQIFDGSGPGSAAATASSGSAAYGDR